MKKSIIACGIRVHNLKNIDIEIPDKNRRSTVGTATEINDYLRLLFARIGKTYCSSCKRHVQIDTVSHIVDTVLTLPEGTKFLVTFPITVRQKVSSQNQINLVKERGLVRILIDANIVDITSENNIDILSAKSVSGIVDRLVVKDVIKERLVGALETAYRLGAGHFCIFYNIPHEYNIL